MEQSIKKRLIFILVLILSSLFVTVLVHGNVNCDNMGMVYLEQGDAAPCDGYLIDENTEEFFNRIYEENQELKHRIQLQSEINQLMNQRINRCEEQLGLCEQTMRELERARHARNLKNYGIAVGVGLAIGLLIAL